MKTKFTDLFIKRPVQPRLQAVEGVQTAEILGAKNFALRAWLNPQKLAAYSLTATDIYAALAANNYLASTGNAKGQMVQINLAADTDLKSLDGFKNLVVKSAAGQVVRLNDVATVAMGADDHETAVAFDGKASVFVGIQVAPGANLLDVVARVRKVLQDIQSQLPVGLKGGVIYDSTKFVNASINEVVKTLAEAVLIVTLVVFAFLGSLRSVIIPLIAIPLSISDLDLIAAGALSTGVVADQGVIGQGRTRQAERGGENGQQLESGSHEAGYLRLMTGQPAAWAWARSVASGSTATGCRTRASRGRSLSESL